jgi:hypothetical protein
MSTKIVSAHKVVVLPIRRSRTCDIEVNESPRPAEHCSELFVHGPYAPKGHSANIAVEWRKIALLDKRRWVKV